MGAPRIPKKNARLFRITHAAFAVVLGGVAAWLFATSRSTWIFFAVVAAFALIKAIVSWWSLSLGHTEGLTVKDSDSPIEKEFETKWRIGARTAVLIVRLTSRFRSEISLSAGEDTVNAKSTVDVVMLQSEADSENTSYATLRDAGLQAGSRIKVTARGPDAAAAMDALSELFSCGARIDLCIEPGCPSPPMLTGYTPDIIHYACSKMHVWTVSRSDASKVQPDA